MSRGRRVPGWKDKALFTPGPLTTSRAVKQAMLRDVGSRDVELIELVRDIRRRLLELARVSAEDYAAVPMQGSGTFALESVVSSAVPPQGKLLVVINGAYGRRMVQIASVLGIDHGSLFFPENGLPDVKEIRRALQDDEPITHVAMVHCETTTGIVNPIRAIGSVVKESGRIYIVDAMSSFGAIPIDLERDHVDFLVSSANKCIEGVPGFAFVLARKKALLASEGLARSLSLDLFSQWQGLEENGQFRFTPPTHVLLAFHQALLELEAEGGVEGRAARYRENHETLLSGMRDLGFKEYVSPELQGYVITSFLYPDHPRFDFEDFYRRLSEKGFLIYPGKLTEAHCFRIASIGRIFPNDVDALL
ncbi:MAG: 2-aminoethylphosphonate--pyruvate transaminase, partial [Acidobacteriota bacterium]